MTRCSMKFTVRHTEIKIITHGRTSRAIFRQSTSLFSEQFWRHNHAFRNFSTSLFLSRGRIKFCLIFNRKPGPSSPNQKKNKRKLKFLMLYCSFVKRRSPRVAVNFCYTGDLAVRNVRGLSFNFNVHKYCPQYYIRDK